MYTRARIVSEIAEPCKENHHHSPKSAASDGIRVCKRFWAVDGVVYVYIIHETVYFFINNIIYTPRILGRHNPFYVRIKGARLPLARKQFVFVQRDRRVGNKPPSVGFVHSIKTTAAAVAHTEKRASVLPCENYRSHVFFFLLFVVCSRVSSRQVHWMV